MEDKNIDQKEVPESNGQDEASKEILEAEVLDKQADSENFTKQQENKSVKQKKKKTRFWPGFFTGMLAAVLILVMIGGGVAYSFLNGNLGLSSFSKTTTPETVPSNTGELDIDKINAKINLLQKIIGQYYLFDEDMSNVEDGIYKGLMSGLNDPYSVYYSEAEYKALTENTSGVYAGIGAIVQQDPDTKIVTVVKVFKSSPAETAGMKAGDILYKVGDVEATSLDLDVLVATYIRGEEGSSVDITVLRGDSHDEVKLDVTRKQIEVPTVEHQMLENQVGYISISQFDDPTATQFEAAIDDLEAQGMKKLIVDVRDNPGGLLDSVVDILDYMLPDGLLVYTADKSGNGNKYYSDDGHEVDVPLAVLVNGNSASASEVFTGAIKDFKWGTIIGTKTFGKGIVQNVLPLGDGTALKITTQHYYTPSGYDLHGKGIEPDDVIKIDDTAVYLTDTDNQLQEALKVLNK